MTNFSPRTGRCGIGIALDGKPFPGEANDVIPKGNLGDVMASLGKQDPNFSVKPSIN